MSSRKSGSNTIFIGKLSSRVREEDLKDEFRRYGRIREIDFRRHRGFAFIEYSSSSDARQAVDEMNGQRFEDTRIVVQYKENRGDRNRRGPDKVDVCFNCGRKGHWANECKEGNWNNKCYRCGKPGHLKKECSLSRTPSSRRDSPKGSRKSSRYTKKSASKSKSVSNSRSRSRSKGRPKNQRRRKHSYSKSNSRSESSKSSRRSRSSSKSKSSSRSKSRKSSSSRDSRNRRNHKRNASQSRSRSNSNKNKNDSQRK